jgi:cation:H+ antiporter
MTLELLTWFAILVAALLVLLKSADIFVEKASDIALSLGIPQAVIGVTLVALGTSLPELAASLSSVHQGAGEFVAGTVVGSNISNILFILGAAALAFGGVSISPRLLRLDLPVLVASAGLLTIMCLDGKVVFVEGLVLLAVYSIYLINLARNHRTDPERTPYQGFNPWLILWLVGAGVGVYLGAEFTVRAVVKLTGLLGLRDTSMLALTVVAVGSSLPELAVTLTAARKQYYDLSVGNIIGSNICNTFLVIGVPSLLQPLPVSASVIYVGLPFMGLATLMGLVYAQVGTISRYAGLILLIIFIYYLAMTIGLA